MNSPKSKVIEQRNSLNRQRVRIVKNSSFTCEGFFGPFLDEEILIQSMGLGLETNNYYERKMYELNYVQATCKCKAKEEKRTKEIVDEMNAKFEEFRLRISKIDKS